MYQAGATSLLDVLDAQRAYNDTMDTYYSAQAAYRRAQAKLTLVVGQEVTP
jgi:outer membrane protein TolC